MPRITPETIIAPVIGIALLAALTLGGVAFALSRHEEAFRQEELRNLLRSECRLFAERCGQELDMIRAELELLAAQTPPDADGIRRAVAGEPFFVDGFVADRSGRLLHAGGDWRRRYNELFTELVSSRSDGADTAPVRPAPQKLRTASSAPAKTGTRSRELVEPVPLHDNARRIVLADQARFSRSAGGEFQPVRRENSERALPAVAAAPEADSPAPRLIPRFAALARGRRSGFIPYFADNRFAPLVWPKARTRPAGSSASNSKASCSGAGSSRSFRSTCRHISASSWSMRPTASSMRQAATFPEKKQPNPYSSCRSRSCCCRTRRSAPR